MVFSKVLVSTTLYNNLANIMLYRSTGSPWSSTSPRSAHHSTPCALEQLYPRNVRSFFFYLPSSVWEPGTMHKDHDQPAFHRLRSPSSGVTN